jgi:hypothetical protein
MANAVYYRHMGAWRQMHRKAHEITARHLLGREWSGASTPDAAIP